MSSNASLKQQLIPFLVIGIGCAVIDFGITNTLDQALDVQRDLAKAVGWVFGTISAYVLNSKFAFNAKIDAKKASAVFILYATTFAVQMLLWRVTDEPLSSIGLQDSWKNAVSFVIAQGVATTTNFLLQRYWIFRGTKGDESPLAPPA
ncbi:MULTISPECIES: GtrA family protein [Corynebacterium]|uniref:GtrA family protein n=1 Tax=Corynebacterium TaxID=1716 RepID=UPI0008A86929|nr:MULTISPECIES: GtrA family protein [Corynebacterium]MDK8663393.1 GtrA family protein [Corynebacterium coyleae]MDK8706989.1 GtrA family protein [Corynebacterium coyleae]MDK8733836.1 GtrA family protein [Corynebacterium coyleae]MDK8822902.1 GtrA family protein [Corynebacterium coyleae]MDK8892957.1 GtrA family protein [Corynebacterium coyleae]